jgi:hypothetical protein
MGYEEGDMTNRKTTRKYAISFTLNMLDLVLGSGWEKFANGGFNDSFGHFTPEELQALMDHLEDITAEEILDTPGGRKTFLGVARGLSNSVYDTAEFLLEDG